VSRFRVFRHLGNRPLTPPPSGNVVNVNAGGNLQAALDAASPGDTLLLEAGATFTGNYTLGTKGSWVTVEGAGAGATIKSTSNVATLTTLDAASYWRFRNLIFSSDSNAGDLVRVGSATQTTLAQVAHHFVFYDCWFKGNPTTGQKRGLSMNSAYTDVVNCDFTDIKLVGQDSMSMIAWNGPGPFLIQGCLIEAAAEGIIFGGADSLSYDLMPKNITFRYNTVRKPESWRPETWQIKNLFELKVGIGVVVENNLFEYHWASAASGLGYAVWLKSTNQDGTATWSEVRDVVFRNNILRNVSGGFTLSPGPQGPNVPMSDVRIENNLIEISKAAWGGLGYPFSITGPVNGIKIKHNTVIHDGTQTIAFDDITKDSTGFELLNNILLDMEYGIKGASVVEGTPTLTEYTPGYDMRGNVLVRVSSTGTYPTGNSFPASLAAAGYNSTTKLLDPGSPYLGTGVDGVDPGWNAPTNVGRDYAPVYTG
jgi:hypothetical protein